MKAEIKISQVTHQPVVVLIPESDAERFAVLTIDTAGWRAKATITDSGGALWKLMLSGKHSPRLNEPPEEGARKGAE
jgi:hypothetical protein